jgi:hypothetical protein
VTPGSLLDPFQVPLYDDAYIAGLVQQERALFRPGYVHLRQNSLTLLWPAPGPGVMVDPFFDPEAKPADLPFGEAWRADFEARAAAFERAEHAAAVERTTTAAWWVVAGVLGYLAVLVWVAYFSGPGLR